MSLPARAPLQARLRTVLVKVSPAPTNLSERRAVLRVLKQHGEVEVFKRLHDPSHFISVVASQTTALGLIARSPLQFDFESPQQQQQHSPGGTTDAINQPNKTFLVKIEDNSEYKHRTHIKESLIYGRWPQKMDPLFSEPSAPKIALGAVVPRDLAWKGLRDWESNGQLEEQEVGLSTWLSSKSDFAAAREERRRRNKSAFQSLVEAYNASSAKEFGLADAGDPGKPSALRSGLDADAMWKPRERQRMEDGQAHTQAPPLASGSKSDSTHPWSTP